MPVVDPSQWLLPAATRAWKGGARARVALVGGDGVGPEVIAAAESCLAALDANLDVAWPRDLEAHLDREAALPGALKSVIDDADAVLFGAVDTSHGRALPVLSYLRFELDAYANIRPAVSIPGIRARTGQEADVVVVRELSEGLYPGREGDLAELKTRFPELRDWTGRSLPDDGIFAVRVVTERASRRVARYAARLAAHRKSLGLGIGKVTVVDKANVLRQSDGLFRRVCSEEIAAAALSEDHVYIDEAARRMVACPEQFDVVVTTNLFGDVLSDVSSEICGGMPMAPSASVGDGSAHFEPCHGSAPDIAGRDVVNPCGTLFSVAMMLSYLHEAEAARRLVGAVIATLEDGTQTADLGGSTSTSTFTAEVCRRLTS